MPSMLTRAALGLVQARDEIGERRLAGSRLADERGRRAGRYLRGDLGSVHGESGA